SFPVPRVQRETGSEESDIHPRPGIVAVKDLYISRGESGLGDMRRPESRISLADDVRGRFDFAALACSISGPHRWKRVSRVEKLTRHGDSYLGPRLPSRAPPQLVLQIAHG